MHGLTFVGLKNKDPQPTGMGDTYYKPFLSDSEYDSKSESESDSDTSYISEESLLNVPGKSEPVPTNSFAPPAGIESRPQKSGTTFETQESKNTTLFMINSRDRDTRVYPQPTFFTLRLPRVYKNVKTINISQLNLLNSFFNFAKTKGNTWMYVYEAGRTRVDPTTGQDISNAVKIQIRDGTYTADDLVAELTNALNSTPIFADISIGNFINRFQSTGDFTIMFNTPGTIVFNSLTQTYDRKQTINDIVARYFTVIQNVGTISYSYDECLVAYYYPVIKEMIIEQPAPVPFSVEGVSLPPGFTSWYDYIVFAFQGLDDPYIAQILKLPGNQAIFNTYRYARTFNNFLVNKYNCTYNSKQGRLIINAPSLNDSIQSDLNTQYTSYLNDLVLSSNFKSIADFQNQYNSINSSNGALIEFYNFIHTNFTNQFGVDFGQYTAEFFANNQNEITIYNTNNKYGWNTSLTAEVSASAISGNMPPTQIPVLWSNIVIRSDIAPATTYPFMSTIAVPEFAAGELVFSNGGESQFGYMDLSFSIVPTGYVRTTFRSRCRQSLSLMTLPRYETERSPGTDQYFRFGSSMTQTPLLYEIPTAEPSTFYIRCDISGSLLFNMYTVQQSMFFSADYMRALDEWLNYLRPQYLAGTRVQLNNPNLYNRPPKNDISLTSYRPALFFQVDADKYLVDPNARFNISFHCETQTGTNFAVPIKIIWYKDRAAMMADVSADLTGTTGGENPRHYFKYVTYGTDLSSAVLEVDVNNMQTTYFMVQTESQSSIVANIPLRIYAVLTNDYGVYTEATQLDRLDMPYQNLPPIIDQFTPASDIYKNPLLSIYTSSITQLGYDSNNVSNNLLDYIVNAGNNNYYDPNSIEDYIDSESTGLRYQFNARTVGATQPPPATTGWSLYFGPNSSNVVRDTYNATSNIYLDKTTPFFVDKNEYTLTNWVDYATTPEQFLNPSGTPINIYSIFMQASNSPTLITDSVTDPVYTDENGMSGLSFFLPPAAIVQMLGVVLKFAYIQPSADYADNIYNRQNSPLSIGTMGGTGSIFRNQTGFIDGTVSSEYDWDDWYLLNRRNVKLGIFATSDIAGVSTNQIALSNALCSLTLEKVTQIGNYQDQLGTLRTREPEWGTYYTYAPNTDISGIIWNVVEPTWTSPTETYFSTTYNTPDFAPIYTAADTVYVNYFKTFPQIYNYTYLERSYGIAPAVGWAVNNPYTHVSSYTADIPNSYTVVPFYQDPSTSNWIVGSFHGVSFTRDPVLPSTSLIGAAAYGGPPGIFGWTQSTNIMVQNLGDTSPFFQPYYWNMKVRTEQLDVEYNPATDLDVFGGFTGISNEFQDTVMFLYANTSTNQDFYYTSTTIGAHRYYVWGQESASRYVAWDDQSGYNYLSYIYDTPVRSTIQQYAVHVRAYDPIPGFNTGIRFIGKNYTDFGRPTLAEIGSEISSLSGYVYVDETMGSEFSHGIGDYGSTMNANNAIRLSTGHFFSHDYADALVRFDESFQVSTIFGKKIGFIGVPFSFSGFNDALNQYITFYSTLTALTVTYTSILSTATGELNTYVQTRYGNILPSTIANRNRITDPLPFQFLFKSTLEPPYDAYPDEWGLGWNLGFNKADTTPPRTTVTSDTFIRIVQDYIYLRFNSEFNMNAMAVSSKEDLAETRESRGQEGKYFAKIILNNFGNFCRTAVQLPIQFTPVLGKIETISCQLTDKYGTQIVNQDCDYDFVLEVTEITNTPKDNSTLLGPESDLAIYAGTKPKA